MNNMGAITREEVEAFAARVLKKLRLDWKMKWTTAQPGICLKKSQEILIPKSMIGQYTWMAREYVLHETAHIFTDDKQHGEEFYKSYVVLLRRFMVKGEAND
ncbi:hypothetical protein ES703_86077 [subsurface metagenome]